ncbi:MAG: SUMF1/EgtB/PvdO family nonheme iron enzyme [Treponema sp.]|nr:SUMF1/EgtB/PvdO family nonheme iron enzyme [Treponema sp.]
MADSSLGKLLNRFRKKVEIKDEDRVFLPEIFGIKPGYYLAVLYGAAALFVLFLILLYPGLSKPGSISVFSSEPAGAAVRVDNITLGSTPCKIFIPQGKRFIEFILPGFESDTRDLEIRGRIFGSLFFPKKIVITGRLVSSDPVGAFALSALEYRYWSAADPTEAYQIPMSLSAGAYRTGPSAKDPAIRNTMQGILDDSLRYAASKASARDLLRAQFLLDNGGLSPSPLTLLRSIKKVSDRLEKNPGAPFWLAGLLPLETSPKVTQSEWFKKNEAENPEQASIGTFDLPFRFARSLTLENLGFVSVNSGYFEKYGRRESMPPLYIALTPVTQAAWDAFTAENPDWSAANRDKLIAQGLVGNDYLVPVDNPAYPVPAAPGISWYAAAAYCAWLSAKLPSSLSGWELRLPSEKEWEYGIRQFETAPPTGRPGRLWEWCSNTFAPLNFFPASEEALEALEKASASEISAVPPPDRVLRGGSWINPPGSVGIETRGSLPPETSSPFVGFRPVIVPKREN